MLGVGEKQGIGIIQGKTRMVVEGREEESGKPLGWQMEVNQGGGQGKSQGSLF